MIYFLIYLIGYVVAYGTTFPCMAEAGEGVVDRRMTRLVLPLTSIFSWVTVLVVWYVTRFRNGFKFRIKNEVRKNN